MVGAGVIALLAMVDFSYGHKLHLSVMNYDYTTRTAIISAITRTGVPPANPFFYPGLPIKLSYHYFWLLFSSLAKRMGLGHNARAALFGSAMWPARLDLGNSLCSKKLLEVNPPKI